MSLRLRLLLATAVIAVVALVGADFATYALLRSSLLDQVDSGLKLSAQSVEHSITSNFPQSGHAFASATPSTGGPTFSTGGTPPTTTGTTAPTPSAFQECTPYELPTGQTRRIAGIGLSPGTVIEVRSSSGKVDYRCTLASLGTTAGQPAYGSAPLRPGGGGGQDPAFTSVSSTAGGSGFRVAVLALPGTGSASGRAAGPQLLVAVPLTATGNTLGSLLDLEIVVTAIAVAVALALGAWLVGLGLRPLRAVERTAGAIAEGQLAERVPGEEKRTEVGRLARALNVMLERIEQAFAERDRTEADLRASEERMRRFVGDASHELRTPLAAVTAYAELFDRGAAERPDDLRRVLRGIRTESGRMGHLVEDLLLLARLDEGRALQSEPVDLVALAADAVAAASVVGPAWPVRLEADRPVELVADGMRVRQVLDNLLVNVRVHCPEGTATVVGIAADAEGAVVRVADDGPGMTAEESGMIFERFWRADPSRSRHHGGAGLGLAIVDAIVRAHGGTVAVESAPDRGTTFVLRLPRAAEKRPAASAASAASTAPTPAQGNGSQVESGAHPGGV